MVDSLFFSPRNSKYILVEPQMAKNFFKSLQRQQRNQTFKFSCYLAVHTDHTGQFNTKYAAICRKTSTDWSSIIPIFDNGFDHHKTLYTLSEYRFFYRMLCILKKQWYYENRWLKTLWDLLLLNEPRHEKSCFCIFKNKGTDYLYSDQLISAFIFNIK